MLVSKRVKKYWKTDLFLLFIILSIKAFVFAVVYYFLRSFCLDVHPHYVWKQNRDSQRAMRTIKENRKKNPINSFSIKEYRYVFKLSVIIFFLDPCGKENHNYGFSRTCFHRSFILILNSQPRLFTYNNNKIFWINFLPNSTIFVKSEILN